MPDFDQLRFYIELAIKDAAVPTSRRARSEWAQYVSGKIAARLRERWEFRHKDAATDWRSYPMGEKRS